MDRGIRRTVDDRRCVDAKRRKNTDGSFERARKTSPVSCCDNARAFAEQSRARQPRAGAQPCMTPSRSKSRALSMKDNAHTCSAAWMAAVARTSRKTGVVSACDKRVQLQRNHPRHLRDVVHQHRPRIPLKGAIPYVQKPAKRSAVKSATCSAESATTGRGRPEVDTQTHCMSVGLRGVASTSSNDGQSVRCTCEPGQNSRLTERRVTRLLALPNIGTISLVAGATSDHPSDRASLVRPELRLHRVDRS